MEYKIEIEKIFDKQIIKNTREIVNHRILKQKLVSKKNNKYNGLFNLICAFMDKIGYIIEEFENISIINKNFNFYYFVLDSSMLIDCINTIVKSIKKIDNSFIFNIANQNLFYNDWKWFWDNQVKIEIDDEKIDEVNLILKSDDAFWEYLRSLCIHPINTDRHPKKTKKENYFHKYLKHQACPFITCGNYLDTELFLIGIRRKKYGYPINITIYPSDVENKNNLDTFSLTIDFHNIEKYVKKYYDSIDQINTWLKNQISEIRASKTENNKLKNNIS